MMAAPLPRHDSGTLAHQRGPAATSPAAGLTPAVGPGDVISTPGRTPHLWATIEADMSYLVFRPDPDGTLTLK